MRSASKGRNSYYYYYHCSTQCGCRYKADVVNNAFIAELNKYSLDAAMKELCAAVLLDVYNNNANESRDDRKTVLKQIDEQNERLRKAREFMLTSKIEPEDYALIKKETEVNLNKLEARITDVAAKPINIGEYVIKAVDVISNIGKLYQNADNEGKMTIIGSMYPEKLHFDGQKHRTARVNEMIELTYLIPAR